MRQLLAVLLVVSSSISLQAQNKHTFRRAHKLFSKFAYADAIKTYEKIHKNYPSDSISIRIAQCYTKLNQPAQVVAWYAKVQDKSSLSAHDYLAFGSALEGRSRYQEAIAWYKKCAAANPDDSRISYKIRGVEQLPTYFKDSALYAIKLLDINSEAYDFAPAFYQQGIAFVSSARKSHRSINRSFQWDHTPFLDIYYAQEYRQGRFYPPVPFNYQVNSRMHEGAMAFNKDFTKIIFTRNNYFKNKKGTSEEKVNKLKLYFGERDKEDEPFIWKNIQEFSFNSDQYSVGDPAMSKDFTKMIFASDMPGGKGGTDLYVSVLRHGKWSEPENLGDAFNTEGDERSPFLHEDGRIFFASNGRDGLGGLDIYAATPDKGGYEVKNMGYPINSRMDDFGFILDAKAEQGYFTSNRPGGAGMDDIYAVKISEKPEPDRLEVCFEVKDQDTDTILSNAQVYMMNLESKAVRSFMTDDQGQICTQLKPNGHYLVKASRTQYLSDCMAVYISDTLSGWLQPERPLVLERLKVEQKFRYEAIYFDLDAFSIRSDAAAELDKIVDFMRSHPGIVVELGSHTDSRGTSMYNEVLSMRRAQSSREYIIAKGIDPKAITAKGYGEYMLTNHCDDGISCTDEEHQQNRRTEIKITGIREVNPEQEARLQSSQPGLDPVKDYSKECDAVKLIQMVAPISVQ